MRTAVLVLAVMLAGCAGSPSLPAAASSAATMPPACADDPGWSDPTPPRQIFGNSWYVGTCAISAVLVTSPQGHVLIDAATDKAADGVIANIRAAGFDPGDIRVILNTHEHNDHAGGIAALQKASGAKVLARKAAADALASGKASSDDPQFGISQAFPAAANVHAIADGEMVTVGPLRIRNIATPGHTLGGSSWAWRSCEGDQCRDIVFADSVTALSDKTYRYDAHPQFVAAFRAGLDRIAALPCEILITTHTQSAGSLMDRLDGKAPLLEPGACKAYARGGHDGLDARLAKEASGDAP